MKKGKLYLIPVTLGSNETINKVLPPYNREVVSRIKIFIVEQVRTARRFLKAMGHPLPIDKMIFYELNKHTDLNKISGYLAATGNGEDVGLISEAGTPCIADPGALIVEHAHVKNIDVVPLVGPNSIILSLMASGFNGQNFAFHGYLPIDIAERKKKIKELENLSYLNDQTQIFIETPYRNNKLLETLVSVLKPNTKICVAADLTLQSEFIKTLPAKMWKKQREDFHKRPAIFLIYKA